MCDNWEIREKATSRNLFSIKVERVKIFNCCFLSYFSSFLDLELLSTNLDRHFLRADDENNNIAFLSFYIIGYNWFLTTERCKQQKMTFKRITMYQLMLYQFSCYCHINNSMRLSLVNNAFITWKVHLMEAQQMFYFMFLRNIQHFHFLKPDSSRLLWKNIKIYSTLGVDLCLMFQKMEVYLSFYLVFCPSRNDAKRT